MRRLMVFLCRIIASLRVMIPACGKRPASPSCKERDDTITIKCDMLRNLVAVTNFSAEKS